MARRSPTGIASITCLILAIILALSISSLQATRLMPENPPINTAAHVVKCPRFLPLGLRRMCKKTVPPPIHHKPSLPTITTQYPPPAEHEHNHDHDHDHNDRDHNDHDVPDLATPPAEASGAIPSPPLSTKHGNN